MMTFVLLYLIYIAGLLATSIYLYLTRDDLWKEKEDEIMDMVVAGTWPISLPVLIIFMFIHEHATRQ